MSDVIKRMIERNDENDVIVKEFAWKVVLSTLIILVLLGITIYWSGYEAGKKQVQYRISKGIEQTEKLHDDPEIDMLIKMGNNQLNRK